MVVMPEMPFTELAGNDPLGVYLWMGMPWYAWHRGKTMKAQLWLTSPGIRVWLEQSLV